MAVPGIIDMYHLANEEIAKKIVDSKTILPFSLPFWRIESDKPPFRSILETEGVNFNEISKLMKSDRFIVGFSEPIPKGWINCGLSLAIVNHIINKSAKVDTIKGQVYSFHMTVKPNFVFIRDSYYISPSYYLKKYGSNLWLELLRSPKEAIKNLYVAEGFARYLKSTMRLSDYLRSGFKYTAPELWYAGTYSLQPFDGIKVLSGRAIKTLKS